MTINPNTPEGESEFVMKAMMNMLRVFREHIKTSDYSALFVFLAVSIGDESSPDKLLSISEISRQTEVHVATTSRIVQMLSGGSLTIGEYGLVKTIPDLLNHRIRRVCLTTKGRALRKELIGASVKASIETTKTRGQA